MPLTPHNLQRTRAYIQRDAECYTALLILWIDTLGKHTWRVRGTSSSLFLSSCVCVCFSRCMYVLLELCATMTVYMYQFVIWGLFIDGTWLCKFFTGKIKIYHHDDLVKTDFSFFLTEEYKCYIIGSVLFAESRKNESDGELLFSRLSLLSGPHRVSGANI